MVEMG